MTEDLEWAIRDVARDLERLYVQLDAAKYAAPPPREVRVMRATPGPREPANLFLMSLDKHYTSRLFEMVGECRTYIEPTMILHHHGQKLCEWVAFKANYIADLDVAPHLLEEMREQARKLNGRLNPPEPKQVANADPYLTADSIQRSLTTKGLACPPATIRSWAQRGHVATKQRRDGHTAYRLADIINRLTSTN